MSNNETTDTPKKPTKAQEQALDIQELQAEVKALKAKLVIVTDAFEFAANEMRPMYGLGAVAIVFDSIYKKLSG